MRILNILLLLFSLASSALAQGTGDAFARARRLVNDGEAKAGRAVVDSMLAAAVPGSAEYADALYWRGVLAENGETARTDLLRVAIEFPLSQHSGDALLRLAQMEFTRGDRVAALRHLNQLAREHPDAPARAAGRYWTARLLFEDANPRDACAALRDAARLAPAADVELVNQIAYYARQCAAIEATGESGRSTDSAAASLPKIGAREPRADGGKRPAVAGKWSVQVAAYSSRESALVLVRTLKGRGLDARVTTGKPWRVRVGHYATRAEAAAVAQRLSSKRSKAMVVEAEKK